jgi:DNA-binding XRE family transcriptional regulator
MTPADRQFGKDLGRLLAQFRQEAGLTQQVVADHLGIAQQTLAHYEVGRLRLPVTLVPPLAAKQKARPIIRPGFVIRVA